MFFYCKEVMVVFVLGCWVIVGCVVIFFDVGDVLVEDLEGVGSVWWVGFDILYV